MAFRLMRGSIARVVARCRAALVEELNIAHVRALNEIAKRRGQSLAQLALAWTLRDPRVTTRH